MQKIELKKIDNKIALDTKVEGCWNDCHTGEYVYSGYNASVYNELGWCTKKEKMSAKKCWFW